MAHSCVQVWKNSHHAFAHSIHLLVLCFEVLKVSFESMVMYGKLRSIDLFQYCLHKNIVVSVCRINDMRKNIIPFSLNCNVAMCSYCRKIKKIDHRRLAAIAYQQLCVFLRQIHNTWISWHPMNIWNWLILRVVCIPCDSKSSFSLVSLVHVLVCGFYHL